MSLITKGRQILREDGPSSFALRATRFANKQAKKRIYGIGSKKICPVCGFSGRKFASAGNPPRNEAQCLKCGARERHRLLWYYIENETNLTNGGRDILHFAPNDKITERLRDCGNNLITADLSGNGVDTSVDITQLPFVSETFDTIICSHVLEHIPDDRAAMSEMKRVLVSGGEALIMVPKDKYRKRTHEDSSVASPDARLREFGQDNHVRVYGNDFAERLSESGFDVSIETYQDELDRETIEKYGLQVSDRSAYFGPAVGEDSARTKYEDIHRCVRPDR